MRALLCKELGTADKLMLEETADPEPGKGEALVEVHAASLNFPDTLIIEGKYQIRPELPFSPGGEAAGIVSAVGKGVDDVAPGDRVIALTGHGAFADKLVAPAADLLPMPASMDFLVASAIGTTYGTSYYALKQRAALQAGETLLVLGAAGGVGLAAVELGNAMGARVIAAASTAEKLDVACEAGAEMRVNYSEESLKDSVKALTNGRGADVVYDPVGGELSEAALRATGWNGRFLVIGFATGDIPRIPLNLTLLKNNAVVGVFWGAWCQRDPQGSQRNFAEIFDLIERGVVKPKVTQVFAIEDYVEAFATLTGRRAKGKVVLRFRAD